MPAKVCYARPRPPAAPGVQLGADRAVAVGGGAAERLCHRSGVRRRAAPEQGERAPLRGLLQCGPNEPAEVPELPSGELLADRCLYLRPARLERLPGPLGRLDAGEVPPRDAHVGVRVIPEADDASPEQ